ncbi:MAG TPA: magnesium transporter CorA family protein [Pseudomonadales bacterium]|nr:magnesium transporter CorA family protein [Pseudomonadales bacterium]
MDAVERRIRVVLDVPGSPVRRGGVELIDDFPDDPAARLWIDMQGPPDAVEQTILVDRFGIGEATVAEAQSPRYPPKVEPFDKHVFMLLRGLDARSDSIEFGTIQIALFVGDRWVISRHTDVSPSADITWDELVEEPELLRSGPGAIAIRLGQHVASRYLPIILKLERRLEQIEDEMFERPGDDLLGELLVYKRHLKKLRRIASYHVTLFTRLQHERMRPFPQAMHHDITEVWEQMERISSLSTLFNDLANDQMNAYLSLSSHRLNHIMKVLTVVTVIFVPLTFVAGIYGMNFENMPELRSNSGYFIVLGVMSTLATALLLVFRRRGWL